MTISDNFSEKFLSQVTQHSNPTQSHKTPDPESRFHAEILSIVVKALKTPGNTDLDKLDRAREEILQYLSDKTAESPQLKLGRIGLSILQVIKNDLQTGNNLDERPKQTPAPRALSLPPPPPLPAPPLMTPPSAKFNTAPLVRGGPRPKLQLTEAEIALKKESILTKFRLDVAQLRGQITEASTAKRSGVIHAIESEISKLRSQSANALAKLNLQGASMSLNEPYDLLDQILGKHQPVKPKSISGYPKELRLEQTLKVGPEERAEIPERLRKEVFEDAVSELSDPIKRSKMISMLGAKDTISNTDLKKKLRAQLALVTPGTVVPDTLDENSAKIKTLTIKIKDILQKDLLDLPLAGYDILSDISLHEISAIVKELAEDRPEIPRFLIDRLRTRRPEILEKLQGAFAKDIAWRVKIKQELQGKLKERTQLLRQQ